MAFLFCVAYFLPGNGRGHRRMSLCPQRLDTDCRLVLIILAPIDKHFPSPEALLQLRDDHIRMACFQMLC